MSEPTLNEPGGTPGQTPNPQPGNNGQATATPPADQDRLVREAADRAAANARRQAEREWQAKLEQATSGARAEVLKSLNLDNEDELAEWSEKIARDREEKQAQEARKGVDREVKKLQDQLQALQKQSEDARARELAAIEKGLMTESVNSILKAVEGVAYNPGQIVHLLDHLIGIDPETGEVGIVEPDGSEDPPWADDKYKGPQGIALYAREWIAQEDNANLRRPAGQGGSGSTAPAGGSAGQADIESVEKKLAAAREANAKGDRRMGPEAVRLAAELRRLKEQSAR